MDSRSLRLTYLVIGLFLGIGAPVGAFLTRFLVMPTVRAAPLVDFEANRVFYTYQLIGSCIVFAGPGWTAGACAERLREAESFYDALSEHDALTGLFNARAFGGRDGLAPQHAAPAGRP